MFFIENKIIWIKKTELISIIFLKILSYLECWILKKKDKNIIQKIMGVKLIHFLSGLQPSKSTRFWL